MSILKTKIGKYQSKKYKSGHTNQEIQMGKYMSGDTKRKIQIGNDTLEIATRANKNR